MQVPRPAPATVISLVALFVALGGTGYAVTALPNNSVGSPQLRGGAVKESDLGNRAVISGKLADQAVTRAKLAPGAVTGDRVVGDTLGGGQIDEASLGRVPFAAEATRALTADRAALADRVEQADRANRATTAATADRAAVADAVARVGRKQLDFVVADGDYREFTVLCDPGLTPVGGGYELDPASSDFPFVFGSSPTGSGWKVKLYDFFAGNGDGFNGTVYVNCLAVDGA